MTPARWLRVQFIKARRKGYVNNAELDPPVTDNVRNCAEAGEDFIVKVVAKTGARYWLTDRRLLLEHVHEVYTLFRYEEVCEAHWIEKDCLRRAFDTPDPQRTISEMKSEYFDRIEVELSARNRPVVLEGLDQAYSPVLGFLRYFKRAEKTGPPSR